MKNFKGVALLAFAVVTAVTFALPAPSASAVSSASLSIIPKKNYVIEQGKSVKDKLTIRNLDGDVPLNLTLRVVDFTFTDDGGTPKLMLDEDAPQTTWSLKPYLTVPKTVSIPPKASKTLDMGISIPKGHGAGSYYSAIIYSSGASDGGNVGLSASGVTLVFTSIPGKVSENLKLTQFGAYHPPQIGGKGGYQFINFNKPKMIGYTLKNDGNVTESPVGSISIKPMIGKEQVISNINPNESLALIGQTRTFTSCIKLKSEEVDFNGTKTKSTACAEPDLWPGHYTVTLDAYYGQNGNSTQELVKTATFWYLPLWFLVLVLAIVAVAAFYIRKAVIKFRFAMYGTKPKRSSRRR